MKRNKLQQLHEDKELYNGLKALHKGVLREHAADKSLSGETVDARFAKEVMDKIFQYIESEVGQPQNVTDKDYVNKAR